MKRDDAIRALLEAAVRAAVSGPGRLDAHSSKATISHESLAGIRAALDELGIDWRRLRADAGMPPVTDERARARQRAAWGADR